jgi:hypothetical protein
MMGKICLGAAALLFVAACTEDEEACYNRISKDLMQSAEFARESGNLAYADTAIDSGYAALAIFADDDRSICDYVTAGPHLQRK